MQQSTWLKSARISSSAWTPFANALDTATVIIMLFSGNAEWHYKGTCIWIASFFSISVNAVMMFLYLRRPKSYSVATLYACIIGFSGISMTIMQETTFLQEAIHPAFAPEWLHQLRKFSLTYYCHFLQEFFPQVIDLFIVCDCINRFILICHPDKKDVFLSKRAVAVTLVIAVLVSCIFSGLTIQIHKDIDSKWNGDTVAKEINGFRRRYTWIYFVALKAIVSIMTAVFHIVITVRIKISLEKSIEFLSQVSTASKGVALYRKVIRFSIFICTIVVFYNIVIMGVNESLLIRRNIFSNFLAHHQFLNKYLIDAVLNVMPYWMNIIICFKPCCYAAAYIWVKRN